MIDPFSEHATVVSGSHNFSTSASTKNDENFIVITGDRALAQAYTVNIICAYEHYRWRAFLSHDPSPFNGLQDNDTWMAPNSQPRPPTAHSSASADPLDIDERNRDAHRHLARQTGSA